MLRHTELRDEETIGTGEKRITIGVGFRDGEDPDTVDPVATVVGGVIGVRCEPHVKRGKELFIV